MCPTCRLRYMDSSTTCLVDGATLQEVKDPRIGTVVAGRYTIEDVLGRGGMATVYRAHHAMARRHVAVKVIHDRFAHDAALRERLLREAAASKQLAHPNVVDMYDHGETDEGIPYLVMELLQGDPLDQHLTRRGGRLPPVEAVTLALQIARGLSRAHDFGIVHRDVKPENVFVCRSDDHEPVVKLVDFGIALSPDDPRLTGTGELLGSPRYMAPERFRDRASVVASSDLYALGVVLFEMVAGQLPFQSESITGFILAHMEELPPRLRSLAPTCPPALDQLVWELMSKDVGERPVDAHAVVAALTPLISERRARIRQVSVSSHAQFASGETLRLDHWAERARMYAVMLERVWPISDPPPELEGALAELNASIARLKALHRKADALERDLAAKERQLRQDRERLGHAVETLGEDLSRARAEQRRDMRTQPGAHAGNWQAAYRLSLAKALQLDANSPDHPTRDGLEALENASAHYAKWLETTDASGVTDLQFQLDALRRQLERLEQEAQGKRRADAERLEKNGMERRTLEARLVALSQTLSNALRPKRELADLFDELQRPKASAH